MSENGNGNGHHEHLGLTPDEAQVLGLSGGRDDKLGVIFAETLAGYKRPVRTLQGVDANYRTPDNVGARFWVYEEADLRQLEEIEADALGLANSEKRLVDVGAGQGLFLGLVGIALNHQGSRIGIEPNPIIGWAGRHRGVSRGLVSDMAESMPDGLDPDRLIAEAFKKHGINANPDDLTLFCEIDQESFEMKEGTATKIPLNDNSADVLTANMMMYHLDPKERKKAFNEFKRVLTPEGTFAMTTSGRHNKRWHRFFEREIAIYLKIQEPAPMNERFYSEKAGAELLDHFDHVAFFDQPGSIAINSWWRTRVYLNSLRSLRDQFEGPPSERVFEKALWRVVVPMIYYKIGKGDPYVDQTERSIFIASNSSKFKIPKGFERLARS